VVVGGDGDQAPSRPRKRKASAGSGFNAGLSMAAKTVRPGSRHRALHDAGRLDVADQFPPIATFQIGGAEEPPIAQSSPESSARRSGTDCFDLGPCPKSSTAACVGTTGLFGLHHAIPSTRLSGSRSSLSAAARTGGEDRVIYRASDATASEHLHCNDGTSSPPDAFPTGSASGRAAFSDCRPIGKCEFLLDQIADANGARQCVKDNYAILVIQITPHCMAAIGGGSRIFHATARAHRQVRRD